MLVSTATNLTKSGLTKAALTKTALTKKTMLFIAVISVFFITSVTASASVIHAQDTDLVIGDFFQIFLPGLGLGMTLYQDDAAGTEQWLKSTGSTILATQILKQSFANTSWGTRPNGASKSFPSGHTSSACSGAAFLTTRYGWGYGAPGFVAAAYVAYSRVDEDMHHWRDVIAGCALGVGFNYHFVTPRNVESTIELNMTDTGVPVIGYSFKF